MTEYPWGRSQVQGWWPLTQEVLETLISHSAFSIHPSINLFNPISNVFGLWDPERSTTDTGRTCKHHTKRPSYCEATAREGMRESQTANVLCLNWNPTFLSFFAKHKQPVSGLVNVFLSGFKSTARTRWPAIHVLHMPLYSSLFFKNLKPGSFY